MTCKKVLWDVGADCLARCGREALVNKEHIQSVDAFSGYLLMKKSLVQVGIGMKYKKRVLGEFL